MALSVRTSATGGNTTSGTNPTAVLTPVVGDLFLVFCQATGNTNAAPTCSDGNTGGAYSLLFTAPGNGSTDTISCFVRNNLLVNTTSTTVTVAIGAHTATEIAVIAVSGATVAGPSAIVQNGTQSNGASGSIPSPSLGAAANYTNLIFSMVGNRTNPAGVTATTGWTRTINAGQTACGLSVEWENQFTGTSGAWGGTSASNYAAAVFEVTIPPNTGVDASKVVGYGLLSPPVGVDASKVIGYGLLSPPVGVDVSKIIGYAVLGGMSSNPPIWPSFAMPDGYVSNGYSTSWDLSPAAAPTTYSVLSGALPTGLTLNSPSGDLGSITGIPTVVGTYSFTLRASNIFGVADQAFTIHIIVPTTSGGGGGVSGWSY